jgi:hypothetical protein
MKNKEKVLKKKEKKPYEEPKIIVEEIFETFALACSPSVDATDERCKESGGGGVILT